MVDKADLLPLILVHARLVKRNEGVPLLLLLAGSSSDPQYERCIVDYAGWLGVRDLVVIAKPDHSPTWYAAADIFVSIADSIQESFGLSVIEAMASGLPQVVSDWDGYRDTVAHGETGFRIPTRWLRCDEDAVTQSVLTPQFGLPHLTLAQSVAVDVRALEEALQRLIESPDLRYRMAENARRRALQHFDWRRVVTQYADLWRELRADASQCRDSPHRTPAYTSPAYYDMFGHYATEAPHEEVGLTMTQLGQQVFDGDLSMPQYHALSPMLSMALATEILRTLGAASNDGAQRTFADVAASLHIETGHSVSTIKRHLMWLLKRGLVEIDAHSVNG